MGRLSKKHRVIAVSLRHFFPEHWDGVGDDYRMAQHVADVIAFIEQIAPKPIDLMGHSRGGANFFPPPRPPPGPAPTIGAAPPRGAVPAPPPPGSAARGPVPARPQ